MEGRLTRFWWVVLVSYGNCLVSNDKVDLLEQEVLNPCAFVRLEYPAYYSMELQCYELVADLQ